ncbi:hypothetical protein AAFX24_28740 [Vibrio mediterranei]|uniref:hypothetical protein n=1 Tax=Vibrio mediterranei TaxID=689 RepID=UPI0038CF03A2
MKYKNDPWVCVDADEDDYTIEQFELRIKGRKPLVLRQPGYGRLTQNTQQYLSCSLGIAKQVIQVAVLDTPEPPTLEEYRQIEKMIEYLENNIKNR